MPRLSSRLRLLCIGTRPRAPPEAGVSSTVRVKPSEVGLLFLQQGNHSTFRRTAHVRNGLLIEQVRTRHQPLDLCAAPPCYRRRRRDDGTERKRFTAALFHIRGEVQFACQRLSLGIQGIFLPGILPDHLRGPHKSILVHSFQSDLVLPKRGSHPYGSLILGVDAAGMGADCTAIIFRRRRHIARVETPYGFDTVDTAGRVEQIIRHEQRHG
jgi:hypothetical protein